MEWRGISFLLYSFSFLLVFSACTLGQFSPEQLEATVQEIAATSMVLTLTAMPSGTLLPSATSTATVALTPTLEPPVALADTATALPDQPTFQASWTPYGLAQPTDFVENKEDKDDKNAPLLLDNESGGEEIHFIILSPVYADYTFTGNMSLILQEGTYKYRAWIGDKGPINGSFSITNGDKHILIFYKDKIHFSTP